MHFLNPWWWLFFLPLAGVLLLLYLLKMRRRDYLVSSVFLWEKALHDLQANAPLQKLRTHLLLLLQLLLLVLVIFALARPAMFWKKPTGKNIVLLLDASASMQSTDVMPSRFAVAKQKAQQAIDGLGPHDTMMLITIGGITRTITPFTNDQRTLHNALDSVQVTDTPGDFSSAIDLIAGLLHTKRAGDKPEVVIISDGAIPPLTIPDGLHLLLNYIQVGRRCDNTGIVMLDVRWQPAHSAYEGLVVLKNYSAKPVKLTLEERLNGRLRDALDITIPAKGQHTEIIRDLPADGGIFRLSLDRRDDFVVDNTAQVVLPKVDPAPVALVTNGNIFLQAALTLDKNRQVKQYPTVPDKLAPHTVLVVDGQSVTELPPGVPTLLINVSAGNALPGKVSKTVQNSMVIDWDRRHPLLSHVDLTELRLQEAQILTPVSAATTIIETDAGPVALTDESFGRRLLQLGWDLRKSDFPLRPSFPIFINNALAWLSGDRERAQALNVRTGQLVRIPLPAGVGKQVTLTTPDNRKIQLTPENNVLTLDQLSKAGLYVIQYRNEKITLAANLLSDSESNNAPKEKLEVQGKKSTVITSRGPVKTETEWWRYLLLLALFVLCIEWVVFHRRLG